MQVRFLPGAHKFNFQFTIFNFQFEAEFLLGAHHKLIFEIYILKISHKYMEQYFAQNAWWIITLALWTIPWKGVALWKAARNSSKAWFICLLVINTVGLLEIIYIFGFSKKKS